jgi:membrane protein DedA with SNARE-associated domain
MINTAIESLYTFVLSHGYWLILIILILESTLALGLIIPGLTILFIAGFLAGIGELNLALVILSAFCGIFIGDSISFYLGRLGILKLPILKRLSDSISESKIRKIIHDKPLLLLFFHFPAYSRIIVPPFLGMTHFDIKKWVIIDICAAFLFTVVIATVGFIVGNTTASLEFAQTVTKYIQWVILALLIVWILFITISLKNTKKS